MSRSIRFLNIPTLLGAENSLPLLLGTNTFTINNVQGSNSNFVESEHFNEVCKAQNNLVITDYFSKRLNNKTVFGTLYAPIS